MEFVFRNLLWASALVLFVGRYSVGAQVPTAPLAPVKHTGALTSVSDDSVSLKDEFGRIVTVAMTPGWTVVSAHALEPGAVRVGDFVASTNVDLDAGSGRSTEVRVLEHGYKPEESTHPIGQPNTSMTHGTIAAVDRDAGGLRLLVTYPAGSRRLLVAPDVKITGYDLHKRSELALGTTVTAITRVGSDGVSRASRLVFGE